MTHDPAKGSPNRGIRVEGTEAASLGGEGSAVSSGTKRVSMAPDTQLLGESVNGEAGDAAATVTTDPAPLVTEKSRSQQALVEAKQSEKAAKKEAKEEERREVLARRQQDALQMLRNIPFVECRVVGTTQGLDKGSSYTAYQIELAVPKDTFKEGAHSMLHRFSDFAALHEALTKAWGRHVDLPKLPAKKVTMMGLSPKQIEERRVGLEAYLAHMVTKLNWSVEPNIRAFFECDKWLKERRTRAMSSAAR